MRRITVLGAALGLFAAATAMAALQANAARAQSDEEAAGASLSGCQGSAVSVDKDGEERDTVSAPGGPASSSSKPFNVVSDGKVNWSGSTDGVIKDFTWSVKLMGVTVKSGSADNDDEKTSDEGVEDVNQYLPFKVTGLYHVDFNLSGEGGECKGDLWVKLDGNPFATVPWFAGIGAVIVGAAGLWWARPGTKPTLVETDTGGLQTGGRR